MSILSKKFYLRWGARIVLLMLAHAISTRLVLAEVRIIASTTQHLIFEYSPDSLAFTIEGESGVRVTARDCGVLYDPGKPVLPCRSLRVGIPETGTPTVTLLEIQTTGQPVPKIFTAPEIGEPNFVPHATATKGSNSFFPADYLSVIGASWLRRQRVLEIEIYPVRYQTNRLEICQKIVVKIEFDASTKSQMNGMTDHMFESAYSHLVLNATVARQWRQAPPKRLDKPTEMPSGAWYIAVAQDGLYQIDYSAVTQIGFDSISFDPARLQIFYGGGRELSPDADSDVVLQEIATGFFDENHDGRLGKHDFLWFFGQGTSGWTFNRVQSGWNHFINHFTNQNRYWVRIGEGSRREMSRKNADQIYAAQVSFCNNYRDRIFQETENINPEKSGIDWMGDWLRGTTSRDYPLELADVLTDKPATLRTRVQGVTEYHHDVSFYLNGQLLQSIDVPYKLAKITPLDVTGILTAGKNTLRTFLQSSAMKNEIFFDWFELEYGRELRTNTDQLDFNSAEHTGVIQYSLTGFSTPGVWLGDVTDPFTVIQFENLLTDSTGQIIFYDSVATSERRYFATTREQIIPVVLVPTSASSSLRSSENAADYVMITHPSLQGNALERLAEHRQLHGPDGQSLQIKIVTTDEIYREFSGGLIDPTAIRNFLRYAYRNWEVAPSYILLVGDACYDIKNNSGGAPATLVPTHEDGSRASDDWFVCLDGDRLMDMFIGRLAVSSPAELETVVNKLIQYDVSHKQGPWKNRLLFVADDAYSPTYTYDDFVFGRDTEALATDSLTAGFDLQKIFLFQYPRDEFGKIPAASQALLRALNQGAVYVNFLGHGNHEVLTHESIFYSPDDVVSLSNGDRLPLFFAGTCAAGYFDFDRKKCLAEELLQKPDGGCFAVIGSSRWNAHAITFIINQAFFRAIFNRTDPPTLGEALLEAKLQCRYPDHREFPVLFGDPAQRLALPQQSIHLSVLPDSLSLSRKVQLQGAIQSAGQTVTDFSGKLFVKLYDAPIKYRPLNYQFTVPGRVLFDDTLVIKNGQCTADFFLDADTAIGGPCNWVAYAWSDPLRTEAIGFLDSVFVRSDSLATDAPIDSVGPQTEVFINGIQITNLESEIAVAPDFTFYARVNDPGSGILISYRPEYRLRLWLDDATDFDLTSEFIFGSPSNHSGSVQFNLADVSVGAHQLVFSVWDQSLNRTTVTLPVYVEPREFALSAALTYPNPAAGKTHFTFTLSHDAEVSIKIYTIAGRLIHQLDEVAARGFNQLPAQGWNCTDRENDPLANGVYLYKIVAKPIPSAFRANSIRQVEVIERLVIMR